MPLLRQRTAIRRQHTTSVRRQQFRQHKRLRQYQPYNPYFNAQEYYQRNNAFDSNAKGKSRGIAALLAIFLGGLGIQYFYLGKTTAGILSIVLTLVTCGIWDFVALIQGILMLCMSNYDFEQKYIENQSTFPVF